MRYVHYLSLLVFWCAFVLFSSCNRNTKTDAKQIIIDVNDKIINNASEVFESITLIQLKTNSADPIGTIESVKFGNNRLIIYDEVTESLVLFDTMGNYMSKIHNIGRGPEEYRSITDFDIINDEILLITSRRQIDIYSMNGEFIERAGKFSFFFDHLVYHKDELLILSESDKSRFRLYKLNDKYEVRDRYYKYDDRAEKYNFWPVHPLFIMHDTVMFYLPDQYTLYKYINGKISEEYKYVFKGIMPDKDYINSDNIDSNKIPVVRGTYFIQNCLVTQFTFENTLYVHFYSLSSRKSKLIKGTEINDDINNLPLLISYFYGYSSNALYGKLPSFLINEDDKSIDGYSKDNDNELLTIFKIKEF